MSVIYTEMLSLKATFLSSQFFAQDSLIECEIPLINRSLALAEILLSFPNFVLLIQVKWIKLQQQAANFAIE